MRSRLLQDKNFVSHTLVNAVPVSTHENDSVSCVLHRRHRAKLTDPGAPGGAWLLPAPAPHHASRERADRWRAAQHPGHQLAIGRLSRVDMRVVPPMIEATSE